MATEINKDDQESYTIKEGLKVVERFFQVPLDYSNPSGDKLSFLRGNQSRLARPKQKRTRRSSPSWCGPGFEIVLQRNSGYAAELYQEGYQILWLDQRGTGLSTPLAPDTLPAYVKTDTEIAAYLKHFRQDNIVRDCEAIRKLILRHKENPEDQKWTLMGHSFGGFCAITYLSYFSEGIKEVFLTGGLAPLVKDPDAVYSSLIIEPLEAETSMDRVIARNKIYYAKYPRDVKRVRVIVAYLDSNDVILPNGGRLTPNRWQQLGMEFGTSGGIDRVHQHVFRASRELETIGKIGYKTLQSIQNTQPFDGNPLYAILHEAAYCQGSSSKWSAERMVAMHSSFSWNSIKALPDDEPLLFTGEMIFFSMFDDYANLRSWKNAANLLANDTTWGPLYDLQQLSKNEVKVSAVTYFDDMYVDFDFAQDTASKIRGTEQYITNQLFHDGITDDSKDVFKRLFQLSKREYV